ncbi:MAG TPA: arylesterase [Candidatus Paceibacterota bacterium]|mgnify:CR=1 FL=1|nr:arylesterase [Candidatus Paceibacterota bacterium]HMP18932.1 arylesterase [Candidatus Paceibacterota bacterium]HMP85095.1 arylesterase [Candidatus Paceibacterota bacterium]
MKKINQKYIIIAIIILVVFLLALYFKTDKNLEKIDIKNINKSYEYKIIAFGDSLTAGFGLPLNESYPFQLKIRLQEIGLDNVDVINSGISGETSRGNLERAQFIRNQNPDIVILGIGGNDALRRLSIEEMENNINQTISILKSGSKPPRIILLQMQAPINYGLNYKKEFDAVYTNLAKKHNVKIVPFLVSEVFRDQNLLLADGIHPNKSGYEKLVNDFLLKPVIEELNK